MLQRCVSGEDVPGKSGLFADLAKVTVDGCEILHQVIDLNGGKHPIIYRVSTCFKHPFGGAGFLPSTVGVLNMQHFF